MSSILSLWKLEKSILKINTILKGREKYASFAIKQSKKKQ